MKIVLTKSFILRRSIFWFFRFSFSSKAKREIMKMTSFLYSIFCVTLSQTNEGDQWVKWSINQYTIFSYRVIINIQKLKDYQSLSIFLIKLAIFSFSFNKNKIKFLFKLYVLTLINVSYLREKQQYLLAFLKYEILLSKSIHSLIPLHYKKLQVIFDVWYYVFQ